MLTDSPYTSNMLSLMVEIVYLTFEHGSLPTLHFFFFPLSRGIIIFTRKYPSLVHVWSFLTGFDDTQFREAAKEENTALLKVMASYGKLCSEECAILIICLNVFFFFCPSCHLLKNWVFIAGEEVVTALGSEVDRLEKEIQELVPGIRHVDIEAHNPSGPSPWSTYVYT